MTEVPKGPAPRDLDNLPLAETGQDLPRQPLLHTRATRRAFPDGPLCPVSDAVTVTLQTEGKREPSGEHPGVADPAGFHCAQLRTGQAPRDPAGPCPAALLPSAGSQERARPSGSLRSQGQEGRRIGQHVKEIPGRETPMIKKGKGNSGGQSAQTATRGHRTLTKGRADLMHHSWLYRTPLRKRVSRNRRGTATGKLTSTSKNCALHPKAQRKSQPARVEMGEDAFAGNRKAGRRRTEEGTRRDEPWVLCSMLANRI